MNTRVVGSLLLLVAVVFAFNVCDFAAQDPTQTMPAAQSAQTDLSGTYTGTFNCEAAGLMGDTTLTITGNQFTTADGRSGRIVASSTGGYTAVALQLGESTPAATTGMTTPATATSAAGGAVPPQIISLRARKSGDRLTLMSVPGSMQKCTFTPTRATARGRRNQRTPAATGTEVANPATAPVPTTSPTTETPIPEQTPAPSPSPSPTVSPSPEASPEPNPSPSPQPTQMPTPFPNPSPSPTASPSPTPSPTPSPAGLHRG
jgi:hypothetical protein